MSVHVAAQTGAGIAASRREAMERNVRPIIGGLTLLVLLLSLIVPALRDPKPHDIPVALVGPAAATAPLEERFATAAPGAFRFVGYASEDEARRALSARDVSGALILRPSGAPTLIVAGAAGGGVSGAINGAIGTALHAQGGSVTVETVHPFASADPQGLILFFLVLGLTASALAAGAVSARRSGSGALVTVSTFAVLAGLVGPWTVEALGAGGYGDRIWLVVALSMLGAAAVGLATVGAGRLFGTAGIALAALVLGPINLISSGGPIGGSFLPDIYRAISPWMPATQTSSAFRGALFFDGAGVGEPVAALAGWAIVGIVLALAADLIRRRSPRTEAA